MPEDPENLQPIRQGRSKTQLACDTCRRRKSRCDGVRPACTHCLHAGAECHYRTASTALDNDSAFMLRLTAIEARLDELENQSSHPDPGHSRDGNAPLHSNELVIFSLDRFPEFHHGGNHKMLHYWSRLRINLTIPDVDILQYLKQSEDRDVRFKELLPAELLQTALPLPLIEKAARSFDNVLSQLPIGFVTLLQSSDLFGTRILSLHNLLSACIDNGIEGIHLGEISPKDLLLLCIFYRSLPSTQGFRTSDICFAIVLQRLWQAQIEVDEVSLPFLLLVAHVFLYIYGMPFKALGILRISDPIITRLFSRAETSTPNGHVTMLNRVFYIFQSDILSEIDGTPSACLPRPLFNDAEVHSPARSRASGTHNMSEDLFLANLWLRSCMNRILTHMFNTDQAYCQPRDVSSIISELSLQLERWFQNLPLDLQFVRDVRSFRLQRASVPIHMRELCLRYHACVAIMKRPVLYHVLYQNMEKSATTPPGSVSEADRHLEPWVLEICRDSIESAKLIILVLASQSRHLSGGLPASSRLPLSPLHEDQSSPSYLSWTDVQLLVGAYALLLSVQTAASFSFAFREITEIGEILDSAEDVLSGISSQSSGYADTLEILTNIRHTFQNSTPLAGL